MINNPFTMVVFIVGIVMIAKVLQAKYRHDHRSGSQAAALPDPEAQRLREEVKALKERVAVLERLATDSSTALEREFEKLKGRD
ncbi:hypothetical protein [Sphingobium phenoxybenzoativorans]|uniref:hypothetical protein n=1 Tax=Sphingobium phenoxybenzoativorans TaxID=1592790 RepID=UPI000871BB04|nr:hypothetical protein [Sphingobium phenoxybenzoativorans]